MNCPTCGLRVLVQNGEITPHINPDTGQPCNTKQTKAPQSEATHDEHAKPAKETAPAKPPVKKTAAKGKT